MTHTVTRLLPEAFERLAAIKTKYPDMKHTALVILPSNSGHAAK